jgi:hypothetical protein
MNLYKVLQGGFSKKDVSEIVDYVGDNPVRFKALIDIFLNGPYRLSQRVSWPMTYCAERHQHLIRPHLKTLLNYLKRPEVDNTIKRNTFRLLQFIDLPRALEGSIAELCFSYLQNRSEPIAVRVFAMTVLSRICEKNPELKQELKILIEDELPFASAGFRSRGMKILKKL